MTKYKSIFHKDNIIIILSLTLLLCSSIHLMKNMNKSTFENNSIGHNDITFYTRNTCPFCVKMKKQLENDIDFDKINVVDIETEKGYKSFKKLNVNGVPHFECQSTGKKSTGYKSTPELLSDLHLT